MSPGRTSAAADNAISTISTVNQNHSCHVSANIQTICSLRKISVSWIWVRNQATLMASMSLLQNAPFTPIPCLMFDADEKHCDLNSDTGGNRYAKSNQNSDMGGTTCGKISTIAA